MKPGTWKYTFVVWLGLLAPIGLSSAQDFMGQYKFEGKLRNFRVYLPENFQDKMPVVFCLHGYKESLDFIEAFTSMHEAADSLGFVTVYPASIFPAWNCGVEGTPMSDLPDTTVNDVGFLSALIDTIHANYQIDLSRVYCCGFSMGGEMTYKMAGQLGNRFAAIASVSGLINNNSAKTMNPLRPMSVLHIHGTNDGYEPYYDYLGDNLASLKEGIYLAKIISDKGVWLGKIIKLE